LEASAISGLSEELLQELYVGSLGDPGEHMQAMTPACALALAANFGSVERWRDEFIAKGKSMGGGSGWLLLVFQRQSQGGQRNERPHRDRQKLDRRSDRMGSQCVLWHDIEPGSAHGP